MLRALLSGLLKTYGILRIPLVLSNMAAVQGRLLNELPQVNLLLDWPKTLVPIQFVFGDQDLLAPKSLVQEVRNRLRPQDTLVTLLSAGHMVHWDQPLAVRQILQRTVREDSEPE